MRPFKHRKPRDKRGVGYHDKGKPQFNEYGQQQKPDAWKEYGLTKREREERAARPPGTDEYGSSLVQPQWPASGGRREGGGGFVLPPRPPGVNDDAIPQSNLNEGRSMPREPNSTNAQKTEVTAEQSTENRETTRQEEDRSGASLGPDGFPDWHRPYSLKKVKKELREHDRQEWKAPVSAERPAIQEKPTSIFDEIYGPGVPLSAYIKPAKQKKKKRGQDQDPQVDVSGNVSSSHDDYVSESEIRHSTEAFDNLQISERGPSYPQSTNTSTAHHSNTPSRELKDPGSQQLEERSTDISNPQAWNTSKTTRPPNLPPKPDKIMAPAPPPLSLFAKSRPIVKLVSANGVITSDSPDINSRDLNSPDNSRDLNSRDPSSRGLNSRNFNSGNRNSRNVTTKDVNSRSLSLRDPNPRNRNSRHNKSEDLDISQLLPGLDFITREILGTSFNGIPNGFYEEQQVCTKTGKILCRTLKRTKADTTVEPMLLPPDGLKGLVKSKQEAAASRNVRPNMTRARLPTGAVIYGDGIYGNAGVASVPPRAAPVRPQDVLRERERRIREKEERDELERRQKEAEQEDLINFDSD